MTDPHPNGPPFGAPPFGGPPAGGSPAGAPPMPPPGEDTVAGPFSDALLDTTVEYTYSGGGHYRLTFDGEHRVRFDFLNAPGRRPDGPAFPTPTLPYRAREVREGLYLVHWIVPQAAIHVSLTIDLTERRVHVAAMMPPNRWEFFDTAVIDRVDRP